LFTQLLLSEVYFALKSLAWSSCGLGLGLALREHAVTRPWPGLGVELTGLEGWVLGLGTCGFVNIPAKLWVLNKQKQIIGVRGHALKFQYWPGTANVRWWTVNWRTENHKEDLDERLDDIRNWTWTGKPLKINQLILWIVSFCVIC